MIKGVNNNTKKTKECANMPEFEILAQHVKFKRIENNETQVEFGLNCGLSDDEISNIENQLTDPKLSTLQNIAAFAGLTVAELLNPEWRYNERLLE